MDRRSILSGSLASGVLSFLPRTAFANPGASPLFPPTNPQVLGPYYPLDARNIGQVIIPESPADHDLVEVLTPNGVLPRPSGQIMHFNGQVLNCDGKALQGAVVELWSTDANGWYIDPDGGPFGVQPTDPQRDVNFQGMGTAVASAHGAFSFRSIRPVPYPFASSRYRASHLHVIVKLNGQIVLTTQIYFRDELTTFLANDPIHGLLSDPNDLTQITPNLATTIPTIDAEGNNVISAHLNLVIDLPSTVDPDYRVEVSRLSFDAPNSRVTMKLTPGRLVDVEMSHDLENWTTVGTNQSALFGMSFANGLPPIDTYFRAKTLPLI